MISILKDMKSGALPRSMWPGFFLYLVRGSFWFLFYLITIAGIILILTKLK